MTLGWTKPVTSISGMPESAVRAISSSFSSVVGTCQSDSWTIVCSPSRSRTSTMCAFVVVIRGRPLGGHRWGTDALAVIGEIVYDQRYRDQVLRWREYGVRR